MNRKILKHYTLPELLDFYKDKHPDHSFFRALMSLTYFEDAEMQPMPKMLCNESWEDMKKTIIEEVRKI